MASTRDNGTQARPQVHDAFDNPPKGPVGVHRGPRSLSVRVLPYLLVVVLAVLCGLGVWAAVSGSLPWQQTHTEASRVISSHLPKRSASSSASSSATATDQASQEQTSEPSTQSPSASASSSSPAPVVNRGTRVTVINGTRVTGYAGKKRQVLVNAGYTAVTASNPQGALPGVSMVRYRDEADKATAQEVANVLGIAQVEQSSVASTPVEAILMQ
ncbi:LytR C-terminal domain-containing protein [Bifidobacterium sp. W8101]|uniref:LytR C-terminal domain-containing protein n=1 Tax=Bifidobacterium TaxID=1678 RepID=UPI0018DCCAB8|nr:MULTISPECIES: LytR C-terminal domain-containing protein [Bifidobacterium]MBI0126760.1 LytR C-terminal domain-containing protein [Bifidobacterium choladohabitans]MBI0128329.1 LytR C-terminal domain-containing protein [Bifidobacterium sp. W8103]MBI0138916.1 LytR C-terminal domain-containing protein [Bifidobacterium sp. W8105]MBI0142847.1 LytR C-terminal domain-containing protein [Bifidobacterium choladohabitans]MBI0147719.1 LytR C-terminal domain-containing protein [Bifidobacterium sp. W8104]